jgi:hypothetical protein
MGAVTSNALNGRFRSLLAEHMNSLPTNYVMVLRMEADEDAMLFKGVDIEFAILI